MEKDRTKLGSKSDAELVDEESRWKEKQRFFNQPGANADLIHWGKMPTWTEQEGVALTFGKKPEIVNWETIKPYVDVSTFAQGYAKLHELAIRSVDAELLSDPTQPKDFVEWAKGIAIDLPDTLAAITEGATPLVERAEQDKKTEINDSHPLAVFRSMNGLCFHEVSIRINVNLTVTITAREHQVSIALSDLDLTVKNKVGLNAQGKALTEMAAREFDPARKGNRKRATRLSDILRDALGTDDHPFVRGLPLPVFNVFLSEEETARKQAGKRTMSYDDHVEATSKPSISLEHELLADGNGISEEDAMANEFFKKTDHLPLTL
jgi:hypothetical protein